MKTRTIFRLISFLLLTGCGSAPTPDVEATQAVQPTPTPIPPTNVPPTNTPAPTDTPVPTDSPVPASPTATKSPFLFSDNFDGALGTGWNWVGEDPTHWSLTDAPGALRIVLQPSNIGDGEPKNFLVRAVPASNFEIATLVHFTPTSNFQFAGLLIYQTQENAMQFGRAFADCGSPTFCPGNAIYFDITEGNQGGKPNYATVVKSDSQSYLRLRREDNTYTGYYSEDGKDWLQIGSHESGITPVYVGLIASQAYQAETTADFESFTIEALP